MSDWIGEQSVEVPVTQILEEVLEVAKVSLHEGAQQMILGQSVEEVPVPLVG